MPIHPLSLLTTSFDLVCFVPNIQKRERKGIKSTREMKRSKCSNSSSTLCRRATMHRTLGITVRPPGVPILYGLSAMNPCSWDCSGISRRHRGLKPRPSPEGIPMLGCSCIVDHRRSLRHSRPYLSAPESRRRVHSSRSGTSGENIISTG